MTDIQQLLDTALESADEYLNAGAQGRQERALVKALDNVIEAVRELAPKPKAAAKSETKDDAPKHKAEKAPAKKAAAKKAAASK
jgi:hypothetical protein